MTAFIALIRGINVSGKNRLPMADLRALFEAEGFSNVETYIQSGNVKFCAPRTSSKKLAESIRAALTTRHAIDAPVLVLSKSELNKAISGNPYPNAAKAPKTLHLFFLSERPNASALAKLEEVRTPTESFQLVGKVLYFHAPDGFGKSKLAAGAERWLGVPTTVRNFNTVAKLQDLAAGG